MSQAQNVFFLSVGRTVNKKGIIVGSYSYHTETDLNGVKQVLEQPNLDMSPGKHYSFTIGEVAWHLIADEFSLIYLLICKQYYPQRVAHACLEELQQQFVAKVGGTSAVEAKDHAYDRTCSTLFQSLCIKYNNLSEVDRLSAVNQKIDTVRVTMQENISIALANCVKLEAIEAQTEELQQQAGVFKKNATELKNKMWWKNMKMWLLIIFIVLVILGIIIGVAVAYSKKN